MIYFMMLIAALLVTPACAATQTKKELPVRVAIIDTGKPLNTDAPVCPTGHKDFSGLGIQDAHGHASHISDVIDQNVKGLFRTLANAEQDNSRFNKDVGYCLVYFKYYNEKALGVQNLLASNQAWEEATRQKVDVIVYAGGGAEYDYREAKAVKAALDAGIKVIAAAGNEASNTNLNPYYPAQYDKRVESVGNLKPDESKPLPTEFCTIELRKKKNMEKFKCGFSSNFGKSVKYWEIGTSVLGKINGRAAYMTGTSQATAVRAGKVVKEMIRSRK